MENNELFNTSKLRNFVRTMASKFLLVEEFPFENRDDEIKQALENAHRFPEKDIEKYAYSLGGRDVENIVFACFEIPDIRLLKILEIRMSKRIMEIIWQLYQFKYKEDNPNIIPMLKIAVDYAEAQNIDTVAAEMLTIFLKGKGKDEIVEMLNVQSLPINSFASLYRFNLKSPMLKSIASKYLSQCDYKAYRFNEAWMVRIIRDVGLQRITDLIINYLTCFSETEYIMSINLSILDKMGYPYSSLEWQEIPDKLKRKFSNWNALRALESHFETKTNNKYILLSKYIEKSKKVFFIRDDQLLVIDFGSFVIIDDSILNEYSFVVEKTYFEKIHEELETNPISSFVKNRGTLHQAREYIIEELESNVFQLDYREVGKLYIKKTLDIMLGIEEDDRPSKDIMKNKKKFSQI